MPASQLTQLKAALTSAGLNRKSASKKDKKTYKKGGARETDRTKKQQKLDDIRRGLNKFDEKETKLKYDVGGRQLKGVTGKPSASKSAGLEQRKKSLLPEHQLRGHSGTFQDRRFGESNPSMTVEDRMLERYTRERQRGQGRKGQFNLEDDDEGLEGFDEGQALGGLTHGGRSVVDMPGDDFDAQGLGEMDDEDRGRIDQRTVGRSHFGGFVQQDEDRNMPDRKRSKQEVMSEVIAKSKSYKYERQQQNDLDSTMREALDDDMTDLMALLQDGAPSKSVAGPSHHPDRAAALSAGGDMDDTDYDHMVRTLASEARAKPKDRTKTEEELAIEEKEKLEKAEATRLRRMRGEEISDDEEGGSRKKRRKTDGKAPDADDLGDDYLEDEEGDGMFGPGLTREQIENMEVPLASEEGSGDDDEEDGSHGLDGSEEVEEDEDDDDDVDNEDDEEVSEMEDLADELDVEEFGGEPDLDDGMTTKKKARPAKNSTNEIPFTFACPVDIEEFEEMLSGLHDSALPIVVQRIRSLHHPSLAQGNKEKLQDFLGILLDYTLILASRPVPAFDLISGITSHIIALVKLNPITAANHFVAKLTLMQKNLARGLARGATREDSRTFPAAPELVILRLIGSIWSTSDFSHPVVAPAVLLMAQYLGQCRVRQISDLAAGLFLCTLLGQYEALSKRLLPEAVNFLGSALVSLLPRRKGAASPAFPTLTIPDLDLSLTTDQAPEEPVNLASVLSSSQEDSLELCKANLVAVALRLVQTYSGLYVSLSAFIEIFDPISLVVQGSRVAKLSQTLKDTHRATIATETRHLNLARSTRTPLSMQAHKPIPIASYAPKFEDNFAPGKHYDPDTERNSAAKLKSLYKKERKGAIRELRKDNRFLAGEKAREQSEKDRSYTAKMRRVEGEINMERAEEKAMQREKARDKRRAGRG